MVPSFTAVGGHVIELSVGADTTWPGDALPQIQEFSRLEVLHLRGGITSLPEWIATLHLLKVLAIDFNPIGIIPDFLDAASNIEQLYARECGLRAFPEAVTRLPNLRVLDLSDNPMGVPLWQIPPPPEPPFFLAGLAPSEMPNLPSSFFSHHGIGFEGKAAARAEAMRMTDDEKARAVADHERQWADYYKLLAWYDSRHGASIPLPDSVCNLRKLEELRISACGFTSLPECLGDLAGLRVLDITWNPVGRLPGSMARLEKLEELHASFCALEALPDLSRAPLRVVQIGSNRLAEIPEYLRERCWLHENVEYNFSDNPLVAPLHGPERSPEKKPPPAYRRATVRWDGQPIVPDPDDIDDDDF